MVAVSTPTFQLPPVCKLLLSIYRHAALRRTMPQKREKVAKTRFFHINIILKKVIFWNLYIIPDYKKIFFLQILTFIVPKKCTFDILFWIKEKFGKNLNFLVYLKFQYFPSNWYINGKIFFRYKFSYLLWVLCDKIQDFNFLRLFF